MNFDHELRAFATDITQEGGSPDIAYDLLQFMLGEEIVTDGLKDGRCGLAVTCKGREALTDDALERKCMDALLRKFLEERCGLTPEQVAQFTGS